MGCSHNCDSCSAGCGGEKSLKVAANPAATVRKVIGVVSGKGGVGKSMTSWRAARRASCPRAAKAECR